MSPPYPGETERALIACPRCHRQWDVAAVPRGERFRCACGEALVAAPRASHAPRPLRCARCGGTLRDGARRCDYCEGEITLEERRLSGVCPECFARLSIGARFCMECGVAIRPQAVGVASQEAPCPRCGAGLRQRSVAEIDVVECSSCAGLWIDPDRFASLCEDADRRELARRELVRAVAPTPVAGLSARAYLACPTCKDFMVPRNFGGASGILVDVCGRHGVWLDHSELERVLEFVRAGGLARAREREVARLESRAARASEPAPAPLVLDPEERRRDLLVEALQGVGRALASWLARR